MVTDRSQNWLLRLPVSFFAIPFGIAGLAGVWRVMTVSYGTPAAIADGVYVIAAAVWLLLAAGVARRLARAPRLVVGELRDPVISPFGSLPAITGMLLAIGLTPYARTAAEIVFVACFVAMALFGGWVIAAWIGSELDHSRFHPGYVLPTVAGGFVGGQAAAGFGWRGLGWMSFGVGLISWLMIGSMTINRLTFVRRLPADLLPILAIELAPPAVGGNAYFALHGSVPDPVLYAFAGYAVLMGLVQMSLLPRYLKVSFTPAFWAFTFTWTSVAAFGIRWVASQHPAGETVYAAVAAGAASALVAAIAARSLVAIAQGWFLPAPDIVADIPVTPGPPARDMEVTP
jgi:tellurite resistance protein